ncbi:MAG: SIS domain-containing protein [Clostridia bacterium]|nr:SIS domain-containing protein [Clostridia bacterium]
MDKKQIFENACQMWDINAKALKSLAQIVNPDEYAAVFEAILNCKGKVATMGMGTSGVAARKIAHMLCVANIPSFFVSAGDAAHGAFGAVQPGDLIIALSKGGNTEELVNLLESIKEKGVSLIAITEKRDSKLATAADICMSIVVEKESDHRHMLPTASIIAIISVFDAICDELTRCPQFTDRAFYYNHNHGAVGAKLKQELHK